MSKYIIYALCEDGVPFYVGKSTTGEQRARKHARPRSLRHDEYSNRAKAARIHTLQAARGGLGYEIQLLDEIPAPSRDSDADERRPHATALGFLERVWIRTLRAAGVVLLNRTDGGENVIGINLGKKMSVVACERMSLSARGKKLSKETKERISRGLIGRPVSNETRARIAATKIGRPRSTETIFKMSAVKVSEETRLKLSAAARGRSPSADTRRKISEAHKGLKRSEEAKAKMCAAWDRRRAANRSECT